MTPEEKAYVEEVMVVLRRMLDGHWLHSDSAFIDYSKEAIPQLLKTIEKQDNVIEKLREAIKFYANCPWDESIWPMETFGVPGRMLIGPDNGKIAC